MTQDFKHHWNKPYGGIFEVICQSQVCSSFGSGIKQPVCVLIIGLVCSVPDFSLGWLSERIFSVCWREGSWDAGVGILITPVLNPWHLRRQSCLLTTWPCWHTISHIQLQYMDQRLKQLGVGNVWADQWGCHSQGLAQTGFNTKLTIWKHKQTRLWKKIS